jgi:hypothetical protein
MIGRELGGRFQEMKYEELIDGFILSLNHRLKAIHDEMAERRQLQEVVKAHQGIITSWLSSEDEKKESREYLQREFGKEWVTPDDIAYSAHQHQPKPGAIDSQQLAKNLVEILGFNKPISQISGPEKEARKALLQQLAAMIPTISPKTQDLLRDRIIATMESDENNAVVQQILVDMLADILDKQFEKFANPAFFDGLFGGVIFPKITEILLETMLTSYMKAGTYSNSLALEAAFRRDHPSLPERVDLKKAAANVIAKADLPARPSTPAPKHLPEKVPEVYRDLTNYLLEAANLGWLGSALQWGAGSKAAGYLTDAIYEYRHSPLLTNQILEFVEDQLAPPAPEETRKADDEKALLLARAKALPNQDAHRANFRRIYDQEAAKKEIREKVQKALPDLDPAALEPLVEQQAKAKEEEAFHKYLIDNVIGSQIAEEKKTQTATSLTDLVTVAAVFGESLLPQKTTWSGWLMSKAMPATSTVAEAAHVRLDNLYTGLFRDRESNKAMIAEIAKSAISTLQRAQAPPASLPTFSIYHVPFSPDDVV